MTKMAIRWSGSYVIKAAMRMEEDTGYIKACHSQTLNEQGLNQLQRWRLFWSTERVGTSCAGQARLHEKANFCPEGQQEDQDYCWSLTDHATEDSTQDCYQIQPKSQDESLTGLHKSGVHRKTQYVKWLLAKFKRPPSSTEKFQMDVWNTGLHPKCTSFWTQSTRIKFIIRCAVFSTVRWKWWISYIFTKLYYIFSLYFFDVFVCMSFEGQILRIGKYFFIGRTCGMLVQGACWWFCQEWKLFEVFVCIHAQVLLLCHPKEWNKQEDHARTVSGLPWESWQRNHQKFQVSHSIFFSKWSSLANMAVHK